MNHFDIENPSIKERLIIQNALAFSFLCRMPIVPGHSLISPIRIVKTCEELSFQEWQCIIELKNELCRALKKTFAADGFNFAWNFGETAGQTVPHFHLHVVPRKAGDAGILQYEPRVFLYRPGNREISEQEELRQITHLIKSHL